MELEQAVAQGGAELGGHQQRQQQDRGEEQVRLELRINGEGGSFLGWEVSVARGRASWEGRLGRGGDELLGLKD